MGRLVARTDGNVIARDVTTARHFCIRGVVQGVGFRPFVYRLAQRHQLVGWVRNTSWGVEIKVGGTCAALDQMARDLIEQTPPLARIEALEVSAVPLDPSWHTFEILSSTPQANAYQLISPDIATCPDCLAEILDPADRRHRYPFTNCTNCGPRFTIITDIPYDRPATTMSLFPMCPACQAEYDDPLDRRFHAQPNACPVCGPHLWLQDAEGHELTSDDPLADATRLLQDGAIVAIKGLGGYQLACDATSDTAVQRLRNRKQRPDKPFALMMTDLAMTRTYCMTTPAERDLLASHAAPIVLLRQRETTKIASQVAPGNRYLGVMLPYTPLHHLLMRMLGRPLVMTSGNLSEEPIACENQDAYGRLAHIADYFLTHNRGIHSRYDDSVWFVSDGQPQPIRRARGFAPTPIKLEQATVPTLACGPQLKNTFCLTRDRYAFLSQHIGDMENLETLTHYEQTLALYKNLFHIEPELIATDLHPDYAATRMGKKLGGTQVSIQHHHAHLAACLADNGETTDAIGVIMDGTGYGLDGHIWGGEFLVGGARGFQRAAHLEYLPLPGGDSATRKPYRIALGYLAELLPHHPLPDSLASIDGQERNAIATMVARRLNTPLTSSAGRLFDAVSALLGLCPEASYEAQAAIALEMIADEEMQPNGYAYHIHEVPGVLGWGEAPCPHVSNRLQIGLVSVFTGILDDLQTGRSSGQIARCFHQTVASIIIATCQRLRETTELNKVALSGGCFQNRLLLTLTRAGLEQAGFTVLSHHQVPCNDGCVSLGQAVIANYAHKGE